MVLKQYNGFNNEYTPCVCRLIYHVDTAGRLGEDHEVCHSQWSSYSHKVLQHILLPHLSITRRQAIKSIMITCMYRLRAVQDHRIMIRFINSQNILSNNIWIAVTSLWFKSVINTSLAFHDMNKRTLRDSAVKGSMTRRMSSTSWPTFLPTWPRWNTKEWGTAPNTSSATWFALKRDFFWFLVWNWINTLVLLANILFYVTS